MTSASGTAHHAIDPKVWQAAMAATRLDHHFADPRRWPPKRRAEQMQFSRIEKVAMIIDDTVICEKGKILV